MDSPITKRLLAKISADGVLRARDAVREGIARTYIQKAVKSGQIERIGRGLYAMPGKVIGENQTLLEATKRVPNGVICLLSALRAHDLTTQNPHEVWICIDGKARKPNIDSPKLRVVRSSKALLSEGVVEKRVGSHSIRLYNPARTVADCFRYRNKIGLDVAVEALRECVRKRRSKMDEIWKYSKLCRVANIMRPYLEVIAG
jgi:predicted transcriptional regulator of viral defense system